MSGLDVGGRQIRKGAAEAVTVGDRAGRHAARRLDAVVERIARSGATPLAVADGPRLLGVIELKDIVKQGIGERFAELRAIGIRTVMITGDNPLTAAAIAQEAGVDDYLAEATPDAKMALIKAEQEGGKLVAMTGDGTNDAPALAQADVGVAMNTGTTAAKEAGNMVDLDSNPTKLIDIVEIGKQLLITRGALTTFSIANDVAKYFAIIPALFSATYPQLQALNIMGLHSPQTAVLSAVIFNALVIVALIPLALRGVRFRPSGAAAILRRNVLIYGVGGIIVPFIFIKLIDLILTATRSSVPHARSPLDVASCTRRRSADVSVIFFVLLGLLYPLAETGIGQAFFSHQANGSLDANGSTLVGQNWKGPQWFQGRPDGDDPDGDRRIEPRPALQGTGPDHQQRIAALRKEGITPTPDLVTTSGSGVDPDITPADAYAQVNAVAAGPPGLPADRVHDAGRRPRAGPAARLPRVVLRQRPRSSTRPGRAALGACTDTLAPPARRAGCGACLATCDRKTVRGGPRTGSLTRDRSVASSRRRGPTSAGDPDNAARGDAGRAGRHGQAGGPRWPQEAPRSGRQLTEVTARAASRWPDASGRLGGPDTRFGCPANRYRRARLAAERGALRADATHPDIDRPLWAPDDRGAGSR